MASTSPPSSSTALTKRSSDTALMPPPPKRIKRPAKVLDEDTYTDALDHIVARDFFPGLLETQAQQEYMEALDSQNPSWIHHAARHLTHVMTPTPDGRRRYGRHGTSMAPTTPMAARATDTPRGWGGETPMSTTTTADETEDEKRAREEQEQQHREREEMRAMSLNAFQSKYTSEDNESFNALLDTQNRKRAEKYAWLWQGNKIASGRLLAHREREQKLLAASAQPPTTANTDRALTRHDPDRDRDPDTRKAMPDHRPAPPRNAFMFAPDSIEDTHLTVAQAAQTASTAPSKAIVYTNTRLPTTTTAPSPPSSPTLSAVNAALAGRPRPTASETAPSYLGSETPRVAGYAFVDEADPQPEEEPDRDLLHRLGITAPADASPNPFSIRHASRRETLHHALVDKSAKAKREASSGGGRVAALKGGAMPRYASSPVVARLNAGGGRGGAGGLTPAGKATRGGGLTPAAQRLLDRVGTPRGKGEGGFGAFGAGGGRTPVGGGKGRERWTPTPRGRRGG